MSSMPYLKRVLAMVLVAMPITGVALTLTEFRHESARAEGLWSVLGGAFGMVYFWGIITGILLSLVHTGITQSINRRSVAVSLGLGLVLGLIAGALTPTFFTGFFNRYVILAGGFTGLVYAAIVSALPPLRE